MTNVIKLAQPGFDIKTAGDESQIYNSNWPLLKIYKQDSFLVQDVTQTTTITTHDLQFPAMYWFFTNNKIDAWIGTTAHVADRRSEFFGPGGDGIVIDNQSLKFTPSSSNDTGSLKLYYYILGIDLTKLFIAPTIKVGGVGGFRTGHVLKLAREKKNIYSTDLRDYTVHSDCRSPLIHSVTPSGGLVKDFYVNHNLGYNPMFFPYQKTTSGYKLLPTGQGGSTSITSDEQRVHFTDTAGKEITIVILKDPFIVDYSVGVTV